MSPFRRLRGLGEVDVAPRGAHVPQPLFPCRRPRLLLPARRAAWLAAAPLQLGDPPRRHRHRLGRAPGAEAAAGAAAGL